MKRFDEEFPVHGADDPAVWLAALAAMWAEMYAASGGRLRRLEVRSVEWMIGPVPNCGWPVGADDQVVWDAAWGQSEQATVRRLLADESKEKDQ